MIPLSLDHTMPPELTIQPSPDHLYEALQWNIKVASLTSMFSCSLSSLYDKVSRTFGVGITTARQTVKTTNQLALRNAILPIHRQFRTEVAQLYYPRLVGPHGKFHTDTLFALIPSLMNCSMDQIFMNDLHFSKFIQCNKGVKLLTHYYLSCRRLVFHLNYIVMMLKS